MHLNALLVVSNFFKYIDMKRFLSGAVLALGVMTAAAGVTPQYPGGDAAMQEFIKTNVKYPPTAAANGIEGNVQLKFIVKADGSISSIKVVRMIDPDLEAEAIRVLKAMPAWTPADKDGTPIDAPATVTIPFRLQ